MEVRIRNTPSFIETARKKQRIVAIGDLHGDREIFWSVLIASGCVKMKKVKGKNKTPKWIGEDTIVVCLGDTTDSKRPEIRVNEEWKKYAGEKQLQFDILDLDHIAKETGGRCLSILGNHDIFAGNNGDYCKEVDLLSYGPEGIIDRIKAYSPGGKMATIFGETRNVIQVVGPCLFVHGSLKPEFFNIFNENEKREIVEKVNREIKFFLKGRKGIPRWFEYSQKKGINPVECRDFAQQPFDTRDIRHFVKSLPGSPRYMVVGHTPHERITRYGPVICTDVMLSRAFGEKQTKYAAEWTEFKGNNVYRCSLDMEGNIEKHFLKTGD
tara:strand:+ start:6329 stop:7303 length:975 start_codon:yes stop_codon:yes gene_type:complete